MEDVMMWQYADVTMKNEAIRQFDNEEDVMMWQYADVTMKNEAI